MPVDVTLLIQLYVSKYLGEKTTESNEHGGAVRGTWRMDVTCRAGTSTPVAPPDGLALKQTTHAQTGWWAPCPNPISRREKKTVEGRIWEIFHLSVVPPTPNLVFLFPWHLSPWHSPCACHRHHPITESLPVRVVLMGASVSADVTMAWEDAALTRTSSVGQKGASLSSLAEFLPRESICL